MTSRANAETLVFCGIIVTLTGIANGMLLNSDRQCYDWYRLDKTRPSLGGTVMSVDIEVVGIGEIAEMAKVSSQAVSNWRRRHSSFPSPIHELRSGPAFNKSEVEKWLQSRNQQRERVKFRLIQTPCCGQLLCWVNPRLPNYCPECGQSIFRSLRFDGSQILIVDDEAWLITHREARLAYNAKPEGQADQVDQQANVPKE